MNLILNIWIWYQTYEFDTEHMNLETKHMNSKTERMNPIFQRMKIPHEHVNFPSNIWNWSLKIWIYLSTYEFCIWRTYELFAKNYLNVSLRPLNFPPYMLHIYSIDVRTMYLYLLCLSMLTTLYLLSRILRSRMRSNLHFKSMLLTLTEANFTGSLGLKSKGTERTNF